MAGSERRTAVADSPGSALSVLKLLADDTRWRLIGSLRWSDRQVGELVSQLDLPQNLVSYHLGVLRQAGLVRVHRSDADARVAYYGLDSAALQRCYHAIGASLYVDHAPLAGDLPQQTVLFLCTANSARSQIAEAWLRHLSHGRLLARSAGTAPEPLHQLAVQVMAEAGIDIAYQRAKGVAELEGLTPDVVVTVCDMAREQCPHWPDTTLQIHWSIPDPAVVRDPGDRAQAFRSVRDELRQRVAALLPLLVGDKVPVAQAQDQMR